MSGETFTCVDCGNRFELSYGEQRYFREHHLELPKRCPACRSRRRAERDADVRDFFGPTTQPAASGPADTGPVSRVPLALTELLLWRKVPRTDYYRYVSRFAHLRESELSSLSVTEAALLLQWMFEQHGLVTFDANAEEHRVDLTLVNREFGWREYARIYLDKNAIPVNAMWTLLNDSEGKDFKRIHFCATATFTPAQKQLRYQFPLTLEILEGAQFEQYLLEAQERFRVGLDRRSTLQIPSAQPTATWWSRLKQTLRNWLGNGK